MEAITVIPNNAKEYDQLVWLGCPEGGELKIVSKAGATAGGKPAVVIAFMAKVGDEWALVQAVTTLNLFCNAARALKSAHEP